ncbi:MAG: cupin domain-containing protein [bacterium]|nr:cupin domain-containing protein [bacterium]
MAVVTISGNERGMENVDEIREFLAGHGIWYRRFDDVDRLGDDATEQQILAAFDEPIGKLKAEGGYTTADVIDVSPQTPNLQAMLDKFSKEHWHDEDEVRFIVRGRGIFHIHPRNDDAVFRIQVEAGDMINVPRGTLHWFDLCDESRIRCIRLFQDPAGWLPHYTDSGEDARHEPLCFGPRYIPTSS